MDNSHDLVGIEKIAREVYREERDWLINELRGVVSDEDLRAIIDVFFNEEHVVENVLEWIRLGCPEENFEGIDFDIATISYDAKELYEKYEDEWGKIGYKINLAWLRTFKKVAERCGIKIVEEGWRLKRSDFVTLPKF